MGDDSSWQARMCRTLIVVVGIAATQVVLYGPSLVGNKILLPLDILRSPGNYLPSPPELRGFRPANRVFADEVVAVELRRRFAVEEVRAGRLPLWNPYSYCGAPFIGANNTAVFSPFRLLDYLFPGPRTIAWVQMLKSLVAGLGMYCFLRRAIGVGFWPAALGAWCFPLIGFLIFWRGYPPSFVVAWLPWLLLATDGAVRRPGGWSGPVLAALTAAVLVSGHMAVAGHVLLTSGLYFVWCLFDEHGPRGLLSGKAVKSVAATGGGWALGFVLSAPQSLPTMDYLQHSLRVARREQGETPEMQSYRIGPAALPQLVLPYCYGSWETGSAWVAPGGRWSDDVYYAPGNRLEGVAAGYAGLIMALFLAPLGWSSRSHRSAYLFWLALGFFALAYLLKVPGLARVFELPPMPLLKNNRFVFATGCAVIVLGTIGLDALLRGEARWRRWFWLIVAVLIGLLGWSVYRWLNLPEAVARGLPPQAGDPAVVQAWFRSMYLASAVTCLIALGAWAVMRFGGVAHPAACFALMALIVGEILWNQRGVNPQSDPALYYPPIPALAQLKQRIEEPGGAGRVCGWNCLPATLNQAHRLPDIRGYDGADPAHLVALLGLAEQQHPDVRMIKPDYAVTQFFLPVESPILDMLNLRYRIYRGTPPADVTPLLTSPDYYVVESATHLPRPYIPRRVEVAERDVQYERMGDAAFDPREIAFIEEPLATDFDGPSEGTAEIIDEIGSRIRIQVDMQTPGIVVLADLWFPGWNAYLDGEPARVLRANYALRGVEVPAGRSVLEFRYEPASFTGGLRLGTLAGIALGVWCAMLPGRGRATANRAELPRSDGDSAGQ